MSNRIGLLEAPDEGLYARLSMAMARAILLIPMLSPVTALTVLAGRTRHRAVGWCIGGGIAVVAVALQLSFWLVPLRHQDWKGELDALAIAFAASILLLLHAASGFIVRRANEAGLQRPAMLAVTLLLIALQTGGLLCVTHASALYNEHKRATVESARMHKSIMAMVEAMEKGTQRNIVAVSETNRKLEREYLDTVGHRQPTYLASATTYAAYRQDVADCTVAAPGKSADAGSAAACARVSAAEKTFAPMPHVNRGKAALETLVIQAKLGPVKTS